MRVVSVLLAKGEISGLSVTGKDSFLLMERNESVMVPNIWI